jgi:hypothetical protein
LNSAALSVKKREERLVEALLFSHAPIVRHRITQSRDITPILSSTYIEVSTSVKKSDCKMALFSSMTWADLAVIFLLSALTYYVALIVYRLWFHPIADFPGPFLARTTFWYEFYYSYVRVGAYYLKVKEMHEKYGTYAIHILVGENLTCPRTHCQDNAR